MIALDPTHTAAEAGQLLGRSPTSVVGARARYRTVTSDPAIWEKNLKEVEEHRRRTGSLPEAKRPGRESSLYIWIALQRQRATSEQRQQLDERIPGWASYHDALWHTRYEELAAYVSEHGRFPSSVHDRRLYLWVNTQQRRARGVQDGLRPLTEDQAALLDELWPDWRP